MEFSIIFDYMPDYVMVRTGGNAKSDDFGRLLEQMTGAPEWKKGTPQIIDHRKLDMKGLDKAGMARIHQMVEKYSKTLGNGPCAIVVKDEVGFGFSRMYEMIGGDTIHQEVRVFYSIDEASAWLKNLNRNRKD